MDNFVEWAGDTDDTRMKWWHFTLADEPYPDTYFTFPVSEESVE